MGSARARRAVSQQELGAGRGGKDKHTPFILTVASSKRGESSKDGSVGRSERVQSCPGGLRGLRAAGARRHIDRRHGRRSTPSVFTPRTCRRPSSWTGDAPVERDAGRLVDLLLEREAGLREVDVEVVRLAGVLDGDCGQRERRGCGRAGQLGRCVSGREGQSVRTGDGHGLGHRLWERERERRRGGSMGTAARGDEIVQPTWRRAP